MQYVLREFRSKMFDALFRIQYMVDDELEQMRQRNLALKVHMVREIDYFN